MEGNKSLVSLFTGLLAFFLMERVNPEILFRNANSDKAGC